MEHSLHIACKHFVETVAPASSSTIRMKIKAALQAASANEDLDLDGLDNDLELAALGLENTEGCDDDTDVEFSHGDVLGKALALVKQVITSRIPYL
jgi:hypothetical protein